MDALLIALACLAPSYPPPERELDCGTAAVYSFCRYQGVKVTVDDARRALEPFGVPPYSLHDLQSALKNLGVETDALRVRETSLPDRQPFIAFLNTSKGGHFIAGRIDRKENAVECVDNRDAWRTTPSELTKMGGWTGVILAPRTERTSHLWWLAVGLLAGGGFTITTGYLFSSRSPASPTTLRPNL